MASPFTEKNPFWTKPHPSLTVFLLQIWNTVMKSMNSSTLRLIYDDSSLIQGKGRIEQILWSEHSLLCSSPVLIKHVLGSLQTSTSETCVVQNDLRLLNVMLFSMKALIWILIENLWGTKENTSWAPRVSHGLILRHLLDFTKFSLRKIICIGGLPKFIKYAIDNTSLFKQPSPLHYHPTLLFPQKDIFTESCI